MNRYRAFRRLLRCESGVAAIEMALVLPVLLVLFFGLIDVTAMLSQNRRLSYSASAVADVVTRLESPTTPEAIADAFMAAQLVMNSGQPLATRVEVYNYRKNASNAVLLQWSRNNGAAVACSQPSTANLLSLMGAGNDIVIVVTCAAFQPILGRLQGWYLLPSFTQREQIATRPRFSLLLDCPNSCNPTTP